MENSDWSAFEDEGQSFTPNEALERLRSFLYRSRPTKIHWLQLCRILSKWPEDRASLLTAIQYIRAHTSEWPTSIRTVPVEWFRAAEEQQPYPVEPVVHQARFEQIKAFASLGCDPASVFVRACLGEIPRLELSTWPRHGWVEIPYPAVEAPVEKEVNAHRTTVMALCVASEAGRLATIDFDGHWAIWDEQSMALLHHGGVGGCGRGISISPDGTLIVVKTQPSSVSVDDSYSLIDCASGEVLAIVSGIYSADISWVGEYIVFASGLLLAVLQRDGTQVDVLSLDRHSVRKVIPGHGPGAWVLEEGALTYVEALTGAEMTFFSGLDQVRCPSSGWESGHFLRPKESPLSPQGRMLLGEADHRYLVVRELATGASLLSFRPVFEEWPEIVWGMGSFSRDEECLLVSFMHIGAEQCTYFLYHRTKGLLPVRISVEGEWISHSFGVFSSGGDSVFVTEGPVIKKIHPAA